MRVTPQFMSARAFSGFRRLPSHVVRRGSGRQFARVKARASLQPLRIRAAAVCPFERVLSEIGPWSSETADRCAMTYGPCLTRVALVSRLRAYQLFKLKALASRVAAARARGGGESAPRHHGRAGSGARRPICHFITDIILSIHLTLTFQQHGARLSVW